ncbi:calmodulin-2 isoform X1 [Corapipo altera]|uniref:calmodulin-2 isoform X1 n=1 Tax=Corapipo altera TaxID=415028 RepID=UPI000FD627F4|nr:calmodulin-2 isoform X1 [Corapipo altera]
MKHCHLISPWVPHRSSMLCKAPGLQTETAELASVTLISESPELLSHVVFLECMFFTSGICSSPTVHTPQIQMQGSFEEQQSPVAFRLVSGRCANHCTQKEMKPLKGIPMSCKLREEEITISLTAYQMKEKEVFEESEGIGIHYAISWTLCYLLHFRK